MKLAGDCSQPPFPEQRKDHLFGDRAVEIASNAGTDPIQGVLGPVWLNRGGPLSGVPFAGILVPLANEAGFKNMGQDPAASVDFADRGTGNRKGSDCYGPI